MAKRETDRSKKRKAFLIAEQKTHMLLGKVSKGHLGLGIGKPRAYVNRKIREAAMATEREMMGTPRSVQDDIEILEERIAEVSEAKAFDEFEHTDESVLDRESVDFVSTEAGNSNEMCIEQIIMADQTIKSYGGFEDETLESMTHDEIIDKLFEGIKAVEREAKLADESPTSGNDSASVREFLTVDETEDRELLSNSAGDSNKTRDNNVVSRNTVLIAEIGKGSANAESAIQPAGDHSVNYGYSGKTVLSPELTKPSLIVSPPSQQVDDHVVANDAFKRITSDHEKNAVVFSTAEWFDVADDGAHKQPFVDSDLAEIKIIMENQTIISNGGFEDEIFESMSHEIDPARPGPVRDKYEIIMADQTIKSYGGFEDETLESMTHDEIIDQLFEGIKAVEREAKLADESPTSGNDSASVREFLTVDETEDRELLSNSAGDSNKTRDNNVVSGNTVTIAEIGKESANAESAIQQAGDHSVNYGCTEKTVLSPELTKPSLIVSPPSQQVDDHVVVVNDAFKRITSDHGKNAVVFSTAERFDVADDGAHKQPFVDSDLAERMESFFSSEQLSEPSEIQLNETIKRLFPTNTCPPQQQYAERRSNEAGNLPSTRLHTKPTTAVGLDNATFQPITQTNAYDPYLMPKLHNEVFSPPDIQPMGVFHSKSSFNFENDKNAQSQNSSLQQGFHKLNLEKTAPIVVPVSLQNTKSFAPGFVPGHHAAMGLPNLSFFGGQSWPRHHQAIDQHNDSINSQTTQTEPSASVNQNQYGRFLNHPDNVHSGASFSTNNYGYLRNPVTTAQTANQLSRNASLGVSVNTWQNKTSSLNTQINSIQNGYQNNPKSYSQPVRHYPQLYPHYQAPNVLSANRTNDAHVDFSNVPVSQLPHNDSAVNMHAHMKNAAFPPTNYKPSNVAPSHYHNYELSVRVQHKKESGKLTQQRKRKSDADGAEVPKQKQESRRSSTTSPKGSLKFKHSKCALQEQILKLRRAEENFSKKTKNIAEKRKEKELMLMQMINQENIDVIVLDDDI